MSRVPSLVLVCDRDRLVTDLLVRGLQLTGLDARPASWGDPAPVAPALVLLDAGPPPEEVLDAAASLGTAPAPMALLVRRAGPPVDDLARRLGAIGLLSRDRPLDDLAAAARLALAGEPLPSHVPAGQDPADDGLGSLTAREREVLALLATGARNDAVAQRLRISPHTVRTHVQNVLLKLGVDNRIAAAAVARRGGLVAAGVGR